ncbi:MAG TPA: rod shape-determining protein MreC, partial [Ilumatobacteraceae bacterium]|nr:rod shape-determining protein MreC [Ilumatobacteraceae bacterium]
MAIYSVGRKRVILALLLTTVLLLTLDLRGNPAIDAAREGFTQVMRPLESATGVVTNPIERIWHGITNYDDLERENLALQEQVDRLIGTQAAAEAAIIEGKELQALYSLPSLSGIDTEVARVVGYAANNLDQVIEIDKGSASGIEVGMAVVNQAGLVGKVTQVTRTSARVMLVTDSRYTVAIKVTSASAAVDTVPTNTSPSGLTPSEVVAAGTTTTTTVPTLPTPVVPGATLPDGSPVPDTTLPGAALGPDGQPVIDPLTGRPLTAEQIAALLEALGDPASSVPVDSVPADSVPADATTETEPSTETTVAPSTTTTTLAEVIEKEYGALEGRGRLRLPQIKFVQDSPSLSELVVGDLVETAGGSGSLAPTGIPVGRVINRADRAGSGGPLLDVEIYADLARLNFVRVVLYKPLSE